MTWALKELGVDEWLINSGMWPRDVYGKGLHANSV